MAAGAYTNAEENGTRVVLPVLFAIVIIGAGSARLLRLGFSVDEQFEILPKLIASLMWWNKIFLLGVLVQETYLVSYCLHPSVPWAGSDTEKAYSVPLVDGPPALAVWWVAVILSLVMCAALLVIAFSILRRTPVLSRKNCAGWWSFTNISFIVLRFFPVVALFCIRQLLRAMACGANVGIFEGEECWDEEHMIYYVASFLLLVPMLLVGSLLVPLNGFFFCHQILGKNMALCWLFAVKSVLTLLGVIADAPRAYTIGLAVVLFLHMWLNVRWSPWNWLPLLWFWAVGSALAFYISLVAVAVSFLDDRSNYTPVWIAGGGGLFIVCVGVWWAVRHPLDMLSLRQEGHNDVMAVLAERDVFARRPGRSDGAAQVEMSVSNAPVNAIENVYDHPHVREHKSQVPRLDDDVQFLRAGKTRSIPDICQHYGENKLYVAVIFVDNSDLPVFETICKRTERAADLLAYAGVFPIIATQDAPSVLAGVEERSKLGFPLYTVSSHALHRLHMETTLGVLTHTSIYIWKPDGQLLARIGAAYASYALHPLLLELVLEDNKKEWPSNLASKEELVQDFRLGRHASVRFGHGASFQEHTHQVLPTTSTV